MVEQRVGAFTRRVEFQAAFDKRHPNPSKNYGVGAVVLRFILIGERGAMQFVCSTGMYPKHVTDEWDASGRDPKAFRAMGYDIGYHAHEPQHEGQSAQDNCTYLGGRACYYDGTSLGAEEFLPTFITGGDDAVWAMLEARYAERFGTEAANG